MSVAKKGAPRTRLLLAASALACVASNPAWAADAATSAEADIGAQDAIIVTGVRGGKPRTVAESPAPIDVIQSSALANATGRADLAESLSRLLPSINFGQTTAGINSVVRPLSNRGLGPAYTLVLVNGKRRHNGALLTNGGGDTSGVNPVDFDIIPLSSVAYVEVLKDSAAAQYGSDAVAGVVNVVLKNSPKGFHAGASVGSLYGGQGDLWVYKAEADAGFKLGEDGGFLHISADARKRGLAWWNFFSSDLPYSPASNPKNATWNGDGAHNGDPEVKAINLGYNAELPISGVTTLYSFGTYGKRDTVIGNNYRRPNGLASFDSVFPNGYYPLNNTDESDYQFLLGARGEVSGWKWDFSSTYGKNRNRQFSDFTINPSLGPTGPTRFDNLATYQFEQWVTNLDVTRGFDIGLAEPLQISAGAEYRVDRFSTFAGDPDAYRNGGYIFKAGDQDGNPNVGKAASVGAQAGVILSPGDEVRLTRHSVAGYLDLGIYPVKDWYVGIAGRVEHYDDSSGTTVGGKVNSRYDFSPAIAIRGTIGTGFRAPSLSQIGYAQTDSRTGTNPVTGVQGPSLSKIVTPASIIGRALGAQDLKPEKSFNLGLGVVLRPLDRVNITIDGYQVTVRDRISRTGTLLGPAVGRILIANGLTGGEYITYFANIADTRSRGVDVVADTTQPLGNWGKLGLSAAYNYNRTKILRVADTPAALTALAPTNTGGSLIYLTRAVRGDLTVTQPRTKLIFTANLDAGPFNVNAQLTRFGAYQYIRSEIVSQDAYFGAKWITDLTVSYTLAKTVRFTVGAANLFDVRPDRNGQVTTATGSASSVYGQSPFSAAGGFYYGKISVDF
ncbi:MAG TPA: TonB-dependent receptor [Sphingobium sp.]